VRKVVVIGWKMAQYIISLTIRNSGTTPKIHICS